MGRQPAASPARWSVGRVRGQLDRQLELPVREIERYHAAAVELAAEARRIVKPALERGFSVETKADASLVTDVDRGIERRLREVIERLFHDSGVIGTGYRAIMSG